MFNILLLFLSIRTYSGEEVSYHTTTTSEHELLYSYQPIVTYDQHRPSRGIMTKHWASKLTGRVLTKPNMESRKKMGKVMRKYILDRKDAIEKYFTNSLVSNTSKTIYDATSLANVVEDMITQGFGNSTEDKLYVGPDIQPSDTMVDVNQAILNIAAFLGQGMQETIKYNACDENNWSNDATYGWYGPKQSGTYTAKQKRDFYVVPNTLDIVPENVAAQGWYNGQPVDYPATAACGQLAQNYGELECEDACPRFTPTQNLDDSGCTTTGDKQCFSATTQAHWAGGGGNEPSPMGGYNKNNAPKGSFNFPPATAHTSLSTNKNTLATNFTRHIGDGTCTSLENHTWSDLVCITKNYSAPLNNQDLKQCGSFNNWPSTKVKQNSISGYCDTSLNHQHTTPPSTLGGSGTVTCAGYECKNIIEPEEITAAKGGWTYLDKIPKGYCVVKDTSNLKTADCHTRNSSTHCTSKSICKWKPNEPINTMTTDCVWWGRGVIQTTGRCNIGRLSKGLQLINKNSPDLCKNPEAICNGDPKIKWSSGFFYWIYSVQNHKPVENDPHNQCDIEKELQNFNTNIDNIQDVGLIHHCSGLVNRGCCDSNCGTGMLDKGPARAEYFKDILKTLNYPAQKQPVDPDTPTPAPDTPTSSPTEIVVSVSEDDDYKTLTWVAFGTCTASTILSGVVLYYVA